MIPKFANFRRHIWTKNLTFEDIQYQFQLKL